MKINKKETANFFGIKTNPLLTFLFLSAVKKNFKIIQKQKLEGGI